MDIRTITKEEYPEGLREIPQPPAKLWLQGTLPSPETKILAVVGSRALTRYGRESCEYLIDGLKGYPISIVSGLALGADACAHRAALTAGLHTIGIPGSGLGKDVLYPRTNIGLAQKIIEAGGALVSEHPPEYAARQYDFPSRNRIMVGMAHAVLMIEAGEKSGTLITARLAAEYNRDLLCVPHRIQDVHSAGSHQFIRLGATLVSEPNHILHALGIEPHTDNTESAQQALLLLTEAERKVFTMLEEPSTRDDILRRSGLPAHEALAALSTLELKGFIKETSGVWHALSLDHI